MERFYVKARETSAKPFILYGIGMNGIRALVDLLRWGIKIDAICDNKTGLEKNL